ncbi:MAG: hypothetical protein ACI9QQ_001876 [Myxococcota bacterium]|jgi:hypothetical protein
MGSYPWAATVALVIALVVDAMVFSSPALWRTIEVPQNLYNLLENAVVNDRRELLDAEPSSVFLIGSSRLEHGFAPDQIPSLGLSRERLVKLAHPHFFPFEMRAVAETVAAHRPEVVVLALAELETHATIDLRSGASFGDMDAVWELVANMGFDYAVEHRTQLMRIAFSGWFDTYHFRGVLNQAGLGAFRRFPGRDGLQSNNTFGSATEASSLEGDQALVDLVAELDAQFPGPVSIASRPQFRSLRSISTGDHARANLALLSRTIEILTEVGTRVVIIEPPLYPRARALYDERAREEFLRFAEEAATHELVSFVPLSSSRKFGPLGFKDLTHLNGAGGRPFARIVTNAIAAELKRSRLNDREG